MSESQITSIEAVKLRIVNVRSKRVLLDSDLALMYGVESRARWCSRRFGS